MRSDELLPFKKKRITITKLVKKKRIKLELEEKANAFTKGMRMYISFSYHQNAY